MNRFGIFALFLISILVFQGCSKSDSDEDPSPSFSSLPRALLGEEIEIDGQGFELGKLQIFFDNEESTINYVTDKKIKVRVPRTLERYNPTVRIVDLNTNKNILEETFFLKEPVITGFDKPEISFDEVLVIEGENFDSSENYVEVEVNGERAQVRNASYNQIEIIIPTNISKSELNVMVTAQLQEVGSNAPLKLTEPEILATTDVFWTGSELVISGTNFNPDRNIGKIFVDGKETNISSASKEELRVYTPVGPYQDFVATNVVYEMGGYEVIFEKEYEILNNAIIVDDNPRVNMTFPAVHNGKAYAYFQDEELGFGYSNNLYEFSVESQQWDKIEGTELDGYLNNLTYNENGKMYVYLTDSENHRILVSVELSNFSKEEIFLPFNDNRSGVLDFYFQGSYYMINGTTYDGFSNNLVEQSYQYDELDEIWTELSSGPIWDYFKSYDTDISDVFYYDGIMYYNYSPQSGITNGYRLKPDATVEETSSRFYFGYQDAVINQYFYYGGFGNYFNDEPGIEHYLGSAWEIGNFFVLEENIYFQKGSQTYKLKKEILDAIL
ncbi:IPT/TIG domain-containing protein [Muricauda sp. ANG21]|uniref:IPT/TIG domain-containing protein n=1 Tax=Allomuricauda sp. ANG21 TaxID=3042468 RepID=UPI003456CECA